MRKKFAPLAVLVALVGTLLVGGASVASADSGYKCRQHQVHSKNLVNISCSNVINAVSSINVDIKNVHVLNNVELSQLVNVLNNSNLDINVIEGNVIKLFNDVFLIKIADEAVQVCNVNILSVKKIETCT